MGFKLNSDTTLYNQLQNQIEDRIKDFSNAIDLNWIKTPFKYHMEIGGKRMRPLLTLLASGLINNEHNHSLDCALAIEILHNFTLVHDDIMDGSPLRRNQETVFKKWDETRAILLGDLMIGYAYQLLPKNIEIVNEFTTGLVDVCRGQVLDIEFNERQDITVDDYLNMIELKTSRIIEAAVKIGVINSNASEMQIKSINDFAKYLGLAFQLQDDLLDLTANTAELGKVIGQDIVEGKKTYLIIRGLEKSKQLGNNNILNQLLEQNGLPIERVNEVRELLSELGIIEETKEKIEHYYRLSLKSLDIFDSNEYKNCLILIIDKLKNRNF